jgi:hypothetical protein
MKRELSSWLIEEYFVKCFWMFGEEEELVVVRAVRRVGFRMYGVFLWSFV